MKKIIEKLPEYYFDYIYTLNDWMDVESGDITKALSITYENTTNLLSDIDPKLKDYRYAPGKWTVAEVLGHLIDADRISAYRALRISREDKENQAGWDQLEFANAANYNSRSLDSIKEELLCTMNSNAFLFEGMNDEQLDTVGHSNNHHATSRILGFIMAGHRQHHLNGLKNNYF